MTQMAGTNPKLAAIFGGSNLGMNVGAMNNAAFQDRSALSQAATAADARAFMADKEAENIVEMGKLNAKGIKAGAGGGTGMAGQALGAVDQIAGLFGGGGGSSFGSSAMSPGGSAGVAGIGGGSMSNPFLTSTLSGY